MNIDYISNQPARYKHWADMTPEEQEASRRLRTEKLEAANQKLATGITNLVASGRWKDYLNFQGRFHQYSFCNTMLIFLQKPDASLVASYYNWQLLGRWIKKGEKGISIFVPILVKVPLSEKFQVIKAGCQGFDESQNPRDEMLVEKLVGFKLGHVFDVSQTDGILLPQSPVSLLQGDDMGLYKSLGIYARDVLKVDVIEEAENTLPFNSNGVCVYGENGKPSCIRIKGNNPSLMKAKTLAHELGHALLHAEREYHQYIDRSLKELEAESVAYIIMNNYGVDSGEYSFGYLAGWGDGEESIKTIQESGERIRKAAHKIISWLEECHEEPVLAGDNMGGQVVNP
jgi:hypothetical protein